MSIQDLSKLIQKRRSIFPNMYNNEPITEDEILTILNNANWAPNHRKTEPWRFKIFKGESLNNLSEYLADYYVNHTDPDRQSAIKLKKTREKPLKSACVIAICVKHTPNDGVPEWEEQAAVACAVQNMWLSCTAMNIGCYWSTPQSALKADTFLSLKEGEKCLGLFYMGKFNGPELPASRKPIEEKIEWM